MTVSSSFASERKTEQEELFSLTAGTEKSLKDTLASSMDRDPTSISLLFTNNVGQNMVSAWWFVPGEEAHGYFIGFKQDDGTWSLPTELRKIKPLCSAVAKYSLPEQLFHSCFDTDAELSFYDRLEEKIMPSLLAAIHKNASDIIVTIQFSTEGYVDGGWFLRQAPDFMTIGQSFLAVPDNHGSWSYPEYFFGNGVSLCDTSIDWKQFPPALVQHMFGALECSDLQ